AAAGSLSVAGRKVCGHGQQHRRGGGPAGRRGQSGGRPRGRCRRERRPGGGRPGSEPRTRGTGRSTRGTGRSTRRTG
ncbi:hypothetical protein GT045_29765, partial [Streptomyces sp. SID486]|nr:hypothetical protein [Streptomyces sp. SID486]